MRTAGEQKCILTGCAVPAFQGNESTVSTDGDQDKQTLDAHLVPLAYSIHCPLTWLRPYLDRKADVVSQLLPGAA